MIFCLANWQGTIKEWRMLCLEFLLKKIFSLCSFVLFLGEEKMRSAGLDCRFSCWLAWWLARSLFLNFRGGRRRFLSLYIFSNFKYLILNCFVVSSSSFYIVRLVNDVVVGCLWLLFINFYPPLSRKKSRPKCCHKSSRSSFF